MHEITSIIYVEAEYCMMARAILAPFPWHCLILTCLKCELHTPKKRMFLKSCGVKFELAGVKEIGLKSKTSVKISSQNVTNVSSKKINK